MTDKTKEELEKQLLRLAADFDNYKKRSEKQIQEASLQAKSDLLKKMLEIVDEFEIALTHLKHADDCIKKGFEMLYVKFLDLLKSEGVVEMKDDVFDPYKHEAIKEEKGPKGKILYVLQKGYMYGDSVLRHAKVVVGNGGVDE